MRTMSVGEAKGKSFNRQKIPKEGTRIRALWDHIHSCKGKVISAHLSSRSSKGLVRALTDFYGCDIRMLDKGKWVFAGEWVDDKYMDYIAANMDQEGR